MIMRKGFPSPREKQKTLKGKPIAKRILERVKEEAAELAVAGWQPKLASVSIGDCEPSQLYIRNQRRVANRCGIDFEELELDESITPSELSSAIAARNADPRVTGIIIQRPVPLHLDVKHCQQVRSLIVDPS